MSRRRSNPRQTSAFSLLQSSKSSSHSWPSVVIPAATIAVSSLLKRILSSSNTTQSRRTWRERPHNLFALPFLHARCDRDSPAAKVIALAGAVLRTAKLSHFRRHHVCQHLTNATAKVSSKNDTSFLRRNLSQFTQKNRFVHVGATDSKKFCAGHSCPTGDHLPSHASSQ